MHHLSEKGAIFPQTLNHRFEFQDGGSFVYIVVLLSRVPLSKGFLVFLEEFVKQLLCSSNNITFLSEIHYYLKTMALYSKL